MKIYNYEFQHPDTNACVTVTVRTDKGQDIAADIAFDNLAIVVSSDFADWYVESVSEEDF